MTTTLRWAVIGTGRFGAVHAEVLASLTDVRLVALCGRAPRVEQLAQRLQTHVEHDYRVLLADPGVEVVSIVTHWRQHFEIARDALLAGKHVLLEKPMAANSAECQELLAIAGQASGLLMVGHVCRFDPRMVLAWQAVRAGRLGKLHALHARRNLPVAPGHVRLDKISPLMGDGIHDADLMMWLLDDVPTRVYGKSLHVSNFTYPDAGWAMLEFGTPAVGIIETVWCLPPQVPTAIDAVLRVIGSEGQLTVNCDEAGVTILDAQGTACPDTAYWPLVHGVRCGALADEMRYFARCIRRGQRPQVITPDEAARAVRVIEAAEKSAAVGLPIDLAWPS